MMHKTLFLLLFFLLMNNCSFIPNKELEGNVYDVGADITYEKSKNKKSLVLALEPAQIRSILKTDYIVIREKNGRLSSYPFRLSESVGQLFNYRIKEAFVNADVADVVVSTLDALPFDMFMKSKITDFQILTDSTLQNKEDKEDKEDKKGVYYFVFAVDTIVSRISDREYVVTKNFEAKYELAELNDKELLNAMRKTMTKVFSSIVRWVDELPVQKSDEKQ